MIALGSSTRNKYQRGKKLLENNISNGTISSNGTGIGNLLKDLFYPEKGVSKPRKTLQEKIYSNQCNISIQRIVKLSKIIKSGDFSSIGFSGNISSYSNGEISEVFCEYLGIENDEVLKTSFKESISGLDIVKEGLSVVDVIAKYMKFSNVRFIKNSETLGPAKTRNIGLQNVASPYILFLCLIHF